MGREGSSGGRHAVLLGAQCSCGGGAVDWQGVCCGIVKVALVGRRWWAAAEHEVMAEGATYLANQTQQSAYLGL